MTGTSFVLTTGGLAFFWLSMLGLLWRRSLIGMLVGVLFGWLSTVVVGAGWILNRSAVDPDGIGALEGERMLVLFGLAGGLQLALGLSIVVARIVRRGSVDVQEAGLLEG